MSLKYRIRLSDDRVIGPFFKEEIVELYAKERISGNELCQLFPVGDWLPISNFKDLSESFIVKESTKTVPLDSDQSLFKEFKFSKNELQDVDYSELEKKHKEELKNKNSNVVPESEPEIEKTKIIKQTVLDDQDKTRINTKKASVQIKKATRVDVDGPVVIKEKTIVQKSKSESVNEKTQFLDINSILPTINTELRASELDFEQQEILEENKIRIKSKEEKVEVELENEKVKKKNKGMKPIIAFAFLAIIYVLLNPEKTVNSVEPFYAKIIFPNTLEYEDASKASLALIKGRESYNKNNYVGRTLASQKFVESLQNQFRSNDALGELILTYSELLEDAKDRNKAANIIYKLIMLSENKTFSDVQVVTGTALFFNKIGKYQSGVNIIKNYLRAKGKTSTKLLSYYLDLLIKAGELSDASKLALKINDIPNKPYESYISLAEYFESDEKQELASKVIAEGLEKYPNSVALILKQADYYLNTKSLEKYEALLLKSKKLNLELSPSYTAKFYKHMGFLAAAKNKNKEASIFFKKSLAIIESEDLRSVLSTLDIKGDKFAQALILESKIIELMKKAEIEIKNLNYETASALSVEAVDADPGYVPAMLQHVRIQLVKGLYDAAIFSLNRLLEKNSNNMQIQTMLIETNIKSYKFDDAQKSLVELSKTKFAFTAEYASLMAYLFEEKKVHHLAIEWYLKALSINPLSDRDLYNLSKICFKLKKFEDAKKYLNKAITLDPKNVEYISLQAQILADQDNADIALGYLRDSISELGESPLLISTIAKIYYSSGQIKEFQSYYKKILAMPKKDENFFEFLIYAAKLEENKVDFTNYAKELLKINPGNLSLQMELAEFYMKEGDLGEARERLNQVNDRLKSYPRLHYLLSKIALRQGDLEKAKAMAEQEKVLNPTLEYSNIMLGEIALAKKDYHESLSQYEQALSLNPKSVEALVAMGKIQLLQNHGREAIDLLLMARRNDKLNPEISKQLGYAYKAAGQRADAKTYFDSYIQLNPGALDRAQIEALIRTLK